MARKTNKWGSNYAHQEGQIGAVRTKRPDYAPKTADCGHVRGEYYVFPARVVQNPGQNKDMATTRPIRLWP